MSKKRKANGSILRRILLVVLAVFIAELLLFSIALTLAKTKIVTDVTNIRLDEYLESSKLLDDPFETGNVPPGYGIESIVYKASDKKLIMTEGVYSLLSEEEINTIINYANKVSFLEIQHGSIEKATNHVFYAYTASSYDTIFIAISSDAYLDDSIRSLTNYVVTLFVSIFVIAAIIILIWAILLVKRINRLCKYVTLLPEEDYQVSYVDPGRDEIYKLSLNIEDMRQTILHDEETKQAMLQNVSHDLKTPIAVIKSYAEAIEDGIEDISSTYVIIEQCNKLEKKVKNFIEFNRLEYLSEEYKDPIKIRTIIEQIILNHKHLLHVEIQEDLDDTLFYGRYENYFTVCENLIENALRYAVDVIKITLKDGVLEIYNDGKHIDEKFIKEGFKPYEKGSEGKFGLGMSIVCRTLSIFNMKLEVRNEEVGVTFTIKAK